MSDTIELNDKLVSELREIAKSLGIEEADDLRKPQLIARITEQQQLIELARMQRTTVEQNYSQKGDDTAAADGDAKPRKRTRTVKPAQAQPVRRPEVPLDDTRLCDMPDD